LHVLKFQKNKQHFEEFEENYESQDVHEEGLVSGQAALGSEQWATPEVSADEFLRGVEEAMEIEHLTPDTEELPREMGMYIYAFYITLHTHTRIYLLLLLLLLRNAYKWKST
jgi:hypothetical protein